MRRWIARRGVVAGVAIGGLVVGRRGAMPLALMVGDAGALVAIEAAGQDLLHLAPARSITT